MYWLRTRAPESSLVVQWPKLDAPNAGGPDLIPGQGTRAHILQRRLKIPCANS